MIREWHDEPLLRAKGLGDLVTSLQNSSISTLKCYDTLATVAEPERQLPPNMVSCMEGYSARGDNSARNVKVRVQL